MSEKKVDSIYHEYPSMGFGTNNELFSNEFIRSQEELWQQLTDAQFPSSHDIVEFKCTSRGKGSSFCRPLSDHQEAENKRDILLMATSREAAPGLHTSNYDNLQDFSQFFDDEVMIEEQRRILFQIQIGHQEQHNLKIVGTSTKEVATCIRSSSTPSSRTGTTLTSVNLFKEAVDYKQQRLHPQVLHLSSSSAQKNQKEYEQYELLALQAHHDQVHPCHWTMHESSTNNHRNHKDASYHYEKDRNIQMGTYNLRIKGTRHAYASISNGSATIVQCSSCRAILQVGSTAKLLYCINCQQITPIEVARNVSADRIGITDRGLAKRVQMQEVEAACSRESFKDNWKHN